MPFASPGQPMPDHIGRRRFRQSWGYASDKVGRVDINLQFNGGSLGQALLPSNGYWNFLVTGDTSQRRENVFVKDGTYTVAASDGGVGVTHISGWYLGTEYNSANAYAGNLQYALLASDRGKVEGGTPYAIPGKRLAQDSVSPNVFNARQGWTTNGIDRILTVDNMTLTLRGLDWSVIRVIDVSALPLIGTVNHCSDPTYNPVTKRFCIPTELIAEPLASNQQIFEIDPATGDFIATGALSIGTAELSGITYRDGGYDWVNFFDNTQLGRIDAMTRANLPPIKTDTSFSRFQGIAAHPTQPWLVVSASRQNNDPGTSGNAGTVAVFDLTGRLVAEFLLTSFGTGSQDGLDWLDGKLGVLRDNGSNSETFVQFYIFPTVLESLSPAGIVFNEDGYQRVAGLSIGAQMTSLMGVTPRASSGNNTLQDYTSGANSFEMARAVSGGTSGQLSGRFGEDVTFMGGGALSLDAYHVVGERYVVATGAKKLFLDGVTTTGTDAIPANAPAGGNVCLGGGHPLNGLANATAHWFAEFSASRSDADCQAIALAPQLLWRPKTIFSESDWQKGAALAQPTTNIAVPAEAVAYFNAMAVPLSPALTSAVATFVYRLKQAGLYADLGYLAIHALPLEQQALINLIDPSRSGVNNGAGFTPKTGFVGNPGASAWVDTGYVWNAIPRFTQTDASIGTWEMTSVVDDTFAMGSSGTAANRRTFGRSSGTARGGRLNGSTTATGSLWATSAGLTVVTRKDTAVQAYGDGLPTGAAGSGAVAAVTGDKMCLLRDNTTYSGRTVGLSFAGAYMDDTKNAAFYMAASALMTALAAS